MSQHTYHSNQPSTEELSPFAAIPVDATSVRFPEFEAPKRTTPVRSRARLDHVGRDAGQESDSGRRGDSRRDRRTDRMIAKDGVADGRNSLSILQFTGRTAGGRRYRLRFVPVAAEELKRRAG